MKLRNKAEKRNLQLSESEASRIAQIFEQALGKWPMFMELLCNTLLSADAIIANQAVLYCKLRSMVLNLLLTVGGAEFPTYLIFEGNHYLILRGEDGHMYIRLVRTSFGFGCVVLVTFFSQKVVRS